MLLTTAMLWQNGRNRELAYPLKLIRTLITLLFLLVSQQRTGRTRHLTMK